MLLAICGAIFHITQYILKLLLLNTEGEEGSSYAEETVNLLILLSIPYCGWRGAKDNDRSLLCWFCGCNLACSCYWPAMALLVHNHIADVAAWCEDCSDAHGFNYDDPTDFNNMSKREELDECLYTASNNRNIDVE